MKGHWLLWVLTLGVFLTVGYLIYKNIKQEPLPQALSFADVNAYSDVKKIVCPTFFTTIEFSDGTNTQCDSIEIANFPVEVLCFTDSNVLLWANPIRQKVDWVGKYPPTEAQLKVHPDVKTLFPNVKVLRAVNIDYDKKRCKYEVLPNPDDKIDVQLDSLEVPSLEQLIEAQ